MSTFRPLALLLILLGTTTLHAEELTVDCDADPPPPGTFATIQLALDSLSPGDVSHTINVSGTCNERITIRFWEFVTIQGPPDGMAIIDGGPADDPTIGPTINIVKARELTLRRLHVRNGGAGISAFASSLFVGASIVEGSREGCVIAGPDSRLEMGNAPNSSVTLRNCNGPGLQVNRALAIVSNTLIENNGTDPGRPQLRANGVFVSSGTASLNNVTVRNNQGSGIGSLNGSQVFLNNTLVENHPTFGITAEHASFVGLGGTIRSNGTAGALYRGGISAIHNSTIRGGANITDNIGPGILLDSGSTMFVGSITVTRNSEEGIRLVRGAILELFVPPSPPGPTRALSGNGGYDVSCDKTVIDFGDTSSVLKSDCSIKKK